MSEVSPWLCSDAPQYSDARAAEKALKIMLLRIVCICVGAAVAWQRLHAEAQDRRRARS